MLGTFDLNIIGLTFHIVGILFIANAVKFKRSRRVLQEYFGVERNYPLKNIREHVVRKLQVYSGFTFFLAGFSLQIISILYENASGEGKTQIHPDLLTIAAILIGSVVVITGFLKIVQVAWTRFTFKRMLIDFFRVNEWELVRNTDIAKEMGELLKIPRHKDDSIEDYVLKIKKALHIETVSESPASQHRRERAEMGIKAGKVSAPKVHPATPPRIE